MEPDEFVRFLVAILMTLEGEYYLFAIRTVDFAKAVAILMTLEGEYYSGIFP